MGQLEDGVRELIKARYKSQADFARRIGLPEHTLYSALSNGLPNATMTTVMPIVKALSLDPVELSQGRLVMLPERERSVPVPLLGTIAAGTPIESTRVERMFPLPAELHEAHPRAFMLQVTGNSMNRILPDGFYVLVEPCDTVDSSGYMYVVAVGDDAATVKRVVLHDNGLTLEPYSHDPTYKPLLFDYSDPGAPQVRVVGRVVWFCPPIDWTVNR